MIHKIGANRMLGGHGTNSSYAYQLWSLLKFGSYNAKLIASFRLLLFPIIAPHYCKWAGNGIEDTILVLLAIPPVNKIHFRPLSFTFWQSRRRFLELSGQTPD